MKDMIPDLIDMAIVAAHILAIGYVVVMTFKCA
jgi:hypothetical protein